MRKLLILCRVAISAWCAIGESVVMNGYTWTYSVSDRKAKITAVVPQPTGILIVPSSLAGFMVESIGDCVFQNCDSLTDVTIPDGVVSIGRRAFFCCGHLVRLTVPESMTYMGHRAFWGCNCLDEVHITSIISWCEISFASPASNPLCYAQYMYVNGALLSNLEIPHGVRQIKQYAFRNDQEGLCLKSVAIPETVQSIGHDAFKKFNNFIRFELPNTIGTLVVGAHAFDPSTVVDIAEKKGHLFEGWKNEAGMYVSDPFHSTVANTVTPCWNGLNPMRSEAKDRSRISEKKEIIGQANGSPAIEYFENLAAVRSRFLGRHDISKMDWSQCINSHGRKESTYWSETILWSDGSWSQSWHGNSRKNCGSIIVIPVSDFTVEKSFAYKDNVGIKKQGKVVSVEISIICTNPNINCEVGSRAVRNYVENGMNIPMINSTAVGGERSKDIVLKRNGRVIDAAVRSGRLISLKSAAKKRFGADVCIYMEGDSADGRVRVLLLGCKAEREKIEISPMTMQ